ncbi:MAG: hypothetical protein ACJAY3_000871 [Neolewinella sp.]|jgi:hypothetical protein
MAALAGGESLLDIAGSPLLKLFSVILSGHANVAAQLKYRCKQ